MNRTLLVSLVAVGLSAASNGEQLRGERVAVFLGFEKSFSRHATEQMRRQAERLLRPLGFVPEWRPLQENRGKQTFPRLAVIQFRGECQGAARSDVQGEPKGSTLALASSLVSAGNVLPYAELYCDELQRFLHSELKGVPAGERERLYGNALGSLVAHELYHILTNSTHHDQEGAGKSQHRPKELLSRNLSFATQELTGLGPAPAGQ